MNSDVIPQPKTNLRTLLPAVPTCVDFAIGELTIPAGAATFPGGSRTGTISVTLVHTDKMPMPPAFGQQPRFIVTVQPPGVHFDPPAPMSIPNLEGLAPGEVTEFFSFEHDLGQFVSLGTGSASDDGSIIRTDPGVGLIKGGWHSAGPPDAAWHRLRRQRFADPSAVRRRQ